MKTAKVVHKVMSEEQKAERREYLREHKEKYPEEYAARKEQRERARYEKHHQLHQAVYAYGVMLNKGTVSLGYLDTLPDSVLRILFREFRKEYVTLQKRELDSLDCGDFKGLISTRKY